MIQKRFFYQNQNDPKEIFYQNQTDPKEAFYSCLDKDLKTNSKTLFSLKSQFDIHKL